MSVRVVSGGVATLPVHQPTRVMWRAPLGVGKNLDLAGLSCSLGTATRVLTLLCWQAASCTQS